MEAVARYAARRPMPAAVVLGVSTPGGVAAIRSLARAGAPVVAVDHRRGALGFRSRLALPVLGPDPVGDPDGYGDLLSALGRALGRPAPLFPLGEEELAGVAANRGRLGDAFLLPLPAGGELERARSARAVLDAALEVGLAVADPPEASASEPTGRISCAALLTPDGTAAAVFVATGGQDPRRAGDAADAALALLRTLGYEGLATVELERDGPGGPLVVLGMAPLLPEWHAAAAARGVDLPRAAYWTLLGARLPPVRAAGAVRVVPGDAVPLDRHDPRPALADAARRVRAALR